MILHKINDNMLISKIIGHNVALGWIEWGFQGGFWTDSNGLFVLSGLMTVGLIAVMYLLRLSFKRNTEQGLSSSVSKPASRTKYHQVDAFRMSGTFFNLGLAVALGISVLAFGWTQVDKPIDIPTGMEELLDEILIEEPPRTAERPPPPPPPPPKIQEVPDETLLEDKTFDDKSAELDDTPPPAPIASKMPPAPVPPPPPPPRVEANEIFKRVEQMPRFPGCENEVGDNAAKKACADRQLLEFIYKNISYPAIARENGVEGMTVITFVVEQNGSISDAHIVRDIGAQCGEEALRVVNLMNEQGVKWTPGKQRGRPVRVQFNLPVKFKLEN